MNKLANKSANRLKYETNALMTKMVRSRQMRIDGKTKTPAYAKCLESIRKTKALCHKIRAGMLVRQANTLLRERVQVRNDTMSQRQLSPAEIVMEHAKANYNSGGWDSIVECETVESITETLKAKGITTTKAALEHYTFYAKIWEQQCAEHLG